MAICKIAPIGGGRIVQKAPRAKSRCVQADFLEVAKNLDAYYVGILRRNDEENFAAVELTKSEVKLLVRMLQTLLDES